VRFVTSSFDGENEPLPVCPLHWKCAGAGFIRGTKAAGGACGESRLRVEAGDLRALRSCHGRRAAELPSQEQQAAVTLLCSFGLKARPTLSAAD